MYEKALMPKLTLSRWPHALPALTLALVFGWAAWERFRLPLTPCVDRDVWAYLGPGLDALLGEPFREWFGQCFLYPWFLYALLRVGGSFRWITLVQGFLGLGTGALMFCCWMELRRLLPAPRLPAFTFKLLGAGLAGVYLFSTATVQFERALRPEAVFPFVVILQIYCNLRFIRARFLDGQPSRALISGGWAIFLSVAAWLLKPSFLGVVVLGNLPIIISLFRAGQPVWGKLLLVAVPVLAAALLLIWPEWMLRQRDPTGPLYLAQSLFSIHADLINDQMAEDLARLTPTPYSPEFLAATHAALTEALRESRGEEGKYWHALGFKADYLRYGDKAGNHAFLRELTDRLGGKEQSVEFCRYYYWRAMRGQPLGMAAKIARQFAVFYRIGRCPAYTTYARFNLGEEYRLSAECLASQRKLPRYPPGVVLLARTAALTNSPLQIGSYRLTGRINQFLSKTHLFWCVWAGLLAVCAWRIQAIRAVFGTAAPVLLLLYAYNFGTVLTLAIAHSLDVSRYSLYQFAYTLLPDFVSVWLAVEALMLFRSFLRSRQKLTDSSPVAG